MQYIVREIDSIKYNTVFKAIYWKRGRHNFKYHINASYWNLIKLIRARETMTYCNVN